MRNTKGALKLAVCAYLLFSRCSIFSQEPLEKSPPNRQQAEELYAKGDANAAIALYKELLQEKIAPEETRAIHLDLAQAYLAAKQFALALEEYEKLLAQNPKDCETRGKLVDLYISFARSDAAHFSHTQSLDWYLNAMTLDPSKRKSLLREYADEISKSGQGREAIKLYKEVLFTGASPSEARLAALGLAQTYIWMENYEEALAIYDQLLEINFKDSEAKKGKANVYVDYARFDMHQGNFKKAIEEFKEAIVLDPSKNPSLLVELGDAFRYNNELDQAIETYKAFIEGESDKETKRKVSLDLALGLIAKFEYEEALKIYDRLLQQNKYDAIAKQGKAKVYLDYAEYNLKQGKTREALEWYYKAIAQDPILRPKTLLQIEALRDQLGSAAPPINEEELLLNACLNTKEESSQTIFTPPPKKESKESPSPIPPIESQTLALPKIEAVNAPNLPSPPPLPLIEEKKPQECAPSEDEILKLQAHKAFEKAKEYARLLEVFQAKRAFEESLKFDPENVLYQEDYAWHLHIFNFIPEALTQFYEVLPKETEKTPYYEVIGWDNRRVGRFNESISAFSHLYDIPPYLTSNDQFSIITDNYEKVYFQKIHALTNQLRSADAQETFEIKKQLFEYYFFIGKLNKAQELAHEILCLHPEEFLVHYRYATLLYQKKKI